MCERQVSSVVTKHTVNHSPRDKTNLWKKGSPLDQTFEDGTIILWPEQGSTWQTSLNLLF